MGDTPDEAAAPTSPDNIPSSLIQTCSQIDGYDVSIYRCHGWTSNKESQTGVFSCIKNVLPNTVDGPHTNIS